MEEKKKYSDDGFYDWLKTQFTDLNSAKEFYKNWCGPLNQQTPFGCFSMRSMAHHVSNVLEGKDCSDPGSLYYDTKYGSELYLNYSL